MQRFFGKSYVFLLVFVVLISLDCVANAKAASSSLIVVGASQADAQFPTEEKQQTLAKDEAEETSETDDAKSKSAESNDSEDDSDNADDEKAKEDQPGSKSDDKSAADDDDAEEAEEEDDEDDDQDKKSNENSDKPKKKEKKKPKPHKVKRDKLKIEVELDGIFVAGEMEEVALRPEVWSRFEVLEAVEHGTYVKKGDILVRFDDEKIEKDLAEEALDQRIAELSLMRDEEEFPRLKRMLELSFESAERKNEQVQADYKYYHATDRPLIVQIANFRYKSAEEELAAAQEELNQLQKMYEADELTEETEEIVLRRQQFAVETAELLLELNKENRDYTLNVSLPRSDESYESAKEAAELSYKQAKTAMEVGLTRNNYNMEKKRRARAESVERHGKFLSDKGLMEVRAPTDGVVYYGKCLNGKWSQVASLQAKLKPFGSAAPNSVLMTIVKPGSLHIESRVGEKELPDLKAGLKATIIPTADKELKLEGRVARVGSIPGASNKFTVELDVDTTQSPEWLVAGMTCDAKVITYENKEAVVVPRDLVQTDEDDEQIKYVMLVDLEEDEPVRRKVKLGRKHDKVVEILNGLVEGDQIIKEEKKDD